jgi:IS30 family transposase
MLALTRGATIEEAAAIAGISCPSVERYRKLEGAVVLRDGKVRSSAIRLDEREEIRLGIDRNETDSQIGDRLGRHRGTIGREITANGGRPRYRAFRAQARADQCARRPKPIWTETRPWLWDEVVALLRTTKWSPEQISTRRSTKRCSCRPRASSDTSWRCVCVLGGRVVGPMVE